LLWDFWRHESWTPKEARVVRLSMGKTMAAAANGKESSVGYEYTVNGIVYHGSWDGDWIAGAKVSAIPSELESRLKQGGTVQFGAMIAGASQALTSGRGGMDEVVIDAAAVVASSARSLAAGIGAESVAESFAGVADGASREAVQEEAETGPADRIAVDTQASPDWSPANPRISIRYNPKSPGRSIVESTAGALSLGYMIGFGAALLAAVGYLGWIYPQVKRWGY
jgi:hypothetical protein